MELSPPSLSWQDTTPVAADFDDVYYSRADGLAEARHVFLHSNGLPERLTERLTIAETGLGTGLNFLALWQMWQQQKELQSLHYITTELHPLSPQDMAKALAAWPELEPLATQLLAIYPPAIKGAHRRYLEGGRITIDFLFGDATEMLARYQQAAGEIKIDAWFLDGFAPAKNETLWNPALYAAMAKLSGEGTTLASFTAAGDVRRGLQEAGFTIQKTRGFGHKRDMIVGRMDTSQPSKARREAAGGAERWGGKPPSATIIGAGIAGISSAWRLAQQGYQVTILEAAETICAGASGNPASAFTPFYPAKWNQRGRLLASGFHAMHHWLQLLRDTGHEIRGSQEGMLMLRSAEDSPRATRATAWQQSLNLPPEIRRAVDAAEASDLAGVNLTHSGWHYPMGGWLHMGDFCAALLADAGDKIQLHFGEKAVSLHHEAGWHVTTQRDTYKTDNVVIANASAASALLPEIKLEPVHGQLLSFETPEEWKNLRMPLHAGHTLIPTENIYSGGAGAALAPTSRMIWGASFRHHLNSKEILSEETERLLGDLHISFPDLYAALTCKPPIIQEWANLRCTHASRMPLIGAVKSEPKGLYLNLAYGARGAVSAAIAFDTEMFS